MAQCVQASPLEPQTTATAVWESPPLHRILVYIAFCLCLKRIALAGIKLLSDSAASSMQDAQNANALSFQPNDNWIFSNSWGPSDNGMVMEGLRSVLL